MTAFVDGTRGRRETAVCQSEAVSGVNRSDRACRSAVIRERQVLAHS